MPRTTSEDGVVHTSETSGGQPDLNMAEKKMPQFNGLLAHGLLHARATESEAKFKILPKSDIGNPSLVCFAHHMVCALTTALTTALTAWAFLGNLGFWCNQWCNHIRRNP